jgi:hypothetical protein
MNNMQYVHAARLAVECFDDAYHRNTKVKDLSEENH